MANTNKKLEEYLEDKKEEEHDIRNKHNIPIDCFEYMIKYERQRIARGFDMLNKAERITEY